MLRRTLLKTPLLAAVAGVTPRIAWGQASAAAQQTIENFFRFPQFSRLKLSPNRQFLAAIAPVKGRGNLAVIDLKARKSMAITSMTDKDVRDFWWVNDERLVFNLIDLRRALGEQLGAGLYAVDRDGGNGRELSTTSPISATGALLYAMAEALEIPRILDEQILVKNESGDTRNRSISWLWQPMRLSAVILSMIWKPCGKTR